MSSPAPAPTRSAIPHTLRIALMCASVVVVAAGLRAAASIFTPLALAGFIAAVNLPALNGLRRRGAPTPVAILFIVLLNGAVLAFFSWIVLETFAELRLELPYYVTRVQILEATVRSQLLEWGLDLAPGYLQSFLQPDQLLDVFTATARNVTSVAAVLFLILLYLVFILAESVELKKKARRAFGARSDALAGVATALAQVQRYLLLKTLISLLTGAAIGIGAGLMGVDFALFWGFLAFALNYIPSIGSIIAAIPAVIVALLQFGPGPALGLTTIYLVVNLVLGNFADPIIVGRQLRLAPIIVLISLVFWGWTWGPIGMFLAVPLTIAMRILMEQTRGLEFLAELMGPAEKVPKRVHPPASV